MPLRRSVRNHYKRNYKMGVLLAIILLAAAVVLCFLSVDLYTAMQDPDDVTSNEEEKPAEEKTEVKKEDKAGVEKWMG